LKTIFYKQVYSYSSLFLSVIDKSQDRPKRSPNKKAFQGIGSRSSRDCCHSVSHTFSNIMPFIPNNGVPVGETPHRRDGVDASDSSDTSSNYSSEEEATNRQKDTEEPPNEIAQAESLAVFRIRAIVVLVLLLSTAGISAIVYIFTSRAETSEFENQFRDDSAKVMEALGSALDRTRGAADAFAITLLSFAKSSNSTWPYVTLPDFPIQAAKSQSLSKSVIIAMYPYVDDSQKSKWEAYSMQNHAWVNKSIDLQKDDPNFHGAIIENWTAYDTIYSNSGPVVTPGPYLPTWQTYPTVPVYPPFNWDLHTSPIIAESVDEVLTSKEVVIGQTLNLVSARILYPSS
jgi:hypothetical protein